MRTKSAGGGRSTLTCVITLSRRVFDDTSYFVTVGLSNTVQLRLLGKYSVMLELLESLLCCLTRYSLFFLVFPSYVLLLSFSEGNKYVFTLFNLRVLSLTEPGLYQETRSAHEHS